MAEFERGRSGAISSLGRQFKEQLQYTQTNAAL